MLTSSRSSPPPPHIQNISWGEPYRMCSQWSWQDQTDWGQTQQGRGCEKNRNFSPKQNLHICFYNSFPQKHLMLKCTSEDNIGLQKDERDRTRLESNLIGWANSALSAFSASFLLWTVILTIQKRKLRLTLNLRRFYLYLSTNFWIFYLHACNFWW